MGNGRLRVEIYSTRDIPHVGNWVRELYWLDLKDASPYSPIVIVDDSCYDLVCLKGEPLHFSFGQPSQKHEIKEGTFTIHGVQPPFRLHSTGKLSFCTIKFQPWANALFLLVLYKQGIVEVESLHGKSTEFLINQIFSASSWEEIQEIAVRFVEGLPLNALNSTIDVQEVCRYVDERAGMVEVQELASYIGVSRQTLNKHFKAQVLYPLKKYLMNVRIVSAIRRKLKEQELSFTELGLEFGYFDQAHFNRDFQKIWGLNPAALFKELPPFFERHQ